MEDQVALINHASVVIEEGGGSTGFTSNLINQFVPYLIIAPGERTNATSQIHIGSLERCAAWVIGDSTEEKNSSSTIDSDILVNIQDFRKTLERMFFLQTDLVNLPKE